MSYNFLIIDPQKDFHEGGQLAVPNSENDVIKYSTFIDDNSDLIDNIFVSLDTHTLKHFGHSGFWDNAYSLSTITYDNKENKFMSTSILPPTMSPGGPRECTMKNIYGNDYDRVREHVIDYIDTLSTNEDGNVATVWNDHCIMGRDGHNIHPTLKTALQGFKNKKKPVRVFIKGQNDGEECYSIFGSQYSIDKKDYKQFYLFGGKVYESHPEKVTYTNPDTNNEMTLSKSYTGEVTIDDGNDLYKIDKLYLRTTFNDEPDSLFNNLVKDGKPICIMGEAMSH